jgi:ribosomal protein S18 acetylase RimI-like enzyme
LIHAARINPIGIDWRRFVVAEAASGAVIACAQIKPHHDGSNELASLVVDEEWRGRGIARKMIEHYLAANYPPLWLTCRSGLIPLYKKFEFHEMKTRDGMPAYFRRVSRLGNLLISVSRRGEYLAVMVWDGP